jgi:hypothetical protein
MLWVESAQARDFEARHASHLTPSSNVGHSHSILGKSSHDPEKKRAGANAQQDHFHPVAAVGKRRAGCHPAPQTQLAVLEQAR